MVSGFDSWKRKQTGRPIYLVIAAIGFTISFYGAYKFYYAPWSRRTRLARAEEYADVLSRREG